MFPPAALAILVYGALAAAAAGGAVLLTLLALDLKNERIW